MLTQPVFISRCSLTVCRRLISGRNIKTLLSARPELSNAFLIGRFGMDIVRQKLVFSGFAVQPCHNERTAIPAGGRYFCLLIAWDPSADMQTPHNRLLRYTNSFKTQ